MTRHDKQIRYLFRGYAKPTSMNQLRLEADAGASGLQTRRMGHRSEEGCLADCHAYRRSVFGRHSSPSARTSSAGQMPGFGAQPWRDIAGLSRACFGDRARDERDDVCKLIALQSHRVTELHGLQREHLDRTAPHPGHNVERIGRSLARNGVKHRRRAPAFCRLVSASRRKEYRRVGFNPTDAQQDAGIRIESDRRLRVRRAGSPPQLRRPRPRLTRRTGI